MEKPAQNSLQYLEQFQIDSAKVDYKFIHSGIFDEKEIQVLNKMLAYNLKFATEKHSYHINTRYLYDPSNKLTPIFFTHGNFLLFLFLFFFYISFLSSKSLLS